MKVNVSKSVKHTNKIDAWKVGLGVSVDTYSMQLSTLLCANYVALDN